MPSLGDAILYLKSNNKGLDDGLNAAETKTKGWAGSLGGKIGPLIGGAVVGGVTLAVGALAGMGKAAFDVATEVDTATKRMQAALNITAEEADALGDVAVGVFKNNFAGSITEAAEAVGLVSQQLGDVVDASEFQTITENAFRLKDAFGVDVTEGVDAAKTLMENFGISSDEAFDLIAAGFQKGLNRSGDFLDTIGEYSTQFANGGANVEQFFNLLDSGLQGGVLGTDKAADAFKEFRVRILDGSDTTLSALSTAFGPDGAQQILDDLASGAITTADVFQEIGDYISVVDDPIKRTIVGTGLLGTQFEDLGDSAVAGLSLFSGAFADVEGSIAAVDAQYNTLPAAIEGFKRQFLVAMIPVGDKLLQLANDIMPSVKVAFDWMADNLPGIIGAVVQAFDRAMAFLSGSVGSSNAEIQALLEDLQAFWDQHGANIMAVLENLGAFVKLTFDTFMGNVLDIVRLALQLLTGDFEGAKESIERLWNRFATNIPQLFGLAINSVLRLMDGFIPGFYEAGNAMISGLWNGISDRFTSLITDARAKFQELRNLLPFSEPKDPSSPFRNLGKSGEAIIRNVQEGLDRASLNLNGAIPSMAGASNTTTVGATTINIYGASDAQGVAREVDNVLTMRRRRGM